MVKVTSPTGLSRVAQSPSICTTTGPTSSSTWAWERTQVTSTFPSLPSSGTPPTLEFSALNSSSFPLSPQTATSPVCRSSLLVTLEVPCTTVPIFVSRATPLHPRTPPTRSNMWLSRSRMVRETLAAAATRLTQSRRKTPMTIVLQVSSASTRLP